MKIEFDMKIKQGSVVLSFIALMFTFLLFSCASENTDMHIGKWKNLSNKAHKESLIVFDELGNYMIQIGDEAMDLDSSDDIGLSYTIDYSKSPVALDIINKETKKAAYKCLVRFPKEGVMQIQMPKGIDSDRPTDFSDERNQVNLERQK